MRIAFAALLGALVTAVLPLPSQAPPGAEPPRDITGLDAVPAANGPADVRWLLAKAALQQGQSEAAIKHLLAALELHPDSPPLLLDLVRATTDSPDAQALWLERCCRAAADAQGRIKFDTAARKRLAGLDLKPAQALATLRAQAAAELARAADKHKGSGRGTLGNGITVRWLDEIALAVMQDAPALLRQHGPALAEALAQQQPDLELVLKGLRRLLQAGQDRATNGAPSTGPAPAQLQDRALRAARIVAGLSRQSGFGKDLQGPPPPDLGDLPQLAAAFLQHFTAEVTDRARVYTVDELLQFDAPQRQAFTQAHRDWRDPGIAESPQQRYRIETICGFETLLGAAQTVELHHARLCSHFGSDPFVQRQGTVRIVPEDADMETEGAPYWWAGGFQGGDRTVIRFAWGDVPGMGKALTHELTHRFDGVLHAFAPSWYGEGHASWTAAHYLRMADASCVEDHLDVGTCAHTFYKGYGNVDKLTQLLEGKVEDYRDNYFAGYSLYAFLRGYPPKQPPRFRAALQKFESNGRAGQKDRLGHFTAVFCDGKDGRPASFATFAEQWNRFLRDCYDWLDERRRSDQNAWVADYGGLGEGRDKAPLVLDPPTWSWARRRAEPGFGQGHAGAAGLLLLEAGEAEAAAAALAWSLQVEGWQPQIATALPELLPQLGRKDAGFAARVLLRQRFPSAMAAAAQPAPMLPQLPRTKAYVDGLAAAAAAQIQLGHRIAAAALRRQQQQLCLQLGVAADAAPGAAADAASDAAADADLPPPAIPRTLTGFGLLEDGLTGYEDHRVQGLWYATPEGDLHVGRDKPRDATGVRDRQAQQRDAFVRTVEWLEPGEYVIRARIHFTTSFASGAVVFGHWRRDRDLRLLFDAGDYQFATGRSEQDASFRRLHVHLEGLWERDGRLPGTRVGDSVDFEPPKSWFDLELRVRGPSVLVLIDDRALFRYTTHDASPIEGSVGFAMSMGAIRVQQPTVQRRDAARPGSPLAAVAAVGLDLDHAAAGEVDDMLLLPTRGLPVARDGTLVLWLPPPDGDVDAVDMLPRALPTLAKLLHDTVELPQPWLLAVPAAMPEARVTAAQQLLHEFRAEPLPVQRHHLAAPFTGEAWLLFVDGTGVLRAAAEVGDAQILTRVQAWARMFRGR